MHATQTTTPTATAQAPEAIPPRAAAALLAVIQDPKSCDKQRRRDLDGLFPSARQPEVRLKWRGVAKSIKDLNRALFSETKVGDDPGVVGEAYRRAQRAAHRDSGATAQMVAHTAIEEMAKSFVTDGTYAAYAVNPDGIRHISGLVGDLQITARELTRKYAGPLGGLAIESVFFAKATPRTFDEARAEWIAEGAIAGREALCDNSQPASVADADFVSAAYEAADLHEQALSAASGDEGAAHDKCSASGKIIERLLEQRAQTITGALARAHLVERFAPTEANADYTDFEWQLVRALIGDVKALFLSQQPQSLNGRQAITTAWLASGMAAYTKGDSYPPKPKLVPLAAE